MKWIFKSKEFPYFFTILIALLAWNLKHVSDQLLDAPLVEYKLVKEVANDNKRKLEYQISNLTRDKSFTELIISLKIPKDSNDEITNPNIDAIPPSSLHETDKDYSVENKQIVNFIIGHLQPGSQYNIECDIEGRGYPIWFLTTKNTVKLVKNSIITWIVKNETALNVVLIILWIILAIMYLINMEKT